MMDQHTNGAALAAGTSERHQVILGQIFNQAWEKVNGIKGTYWLAILISVVGSAVISLLFGLVSAVLLGKGSALAALLEGLVNAAVGASFSAGLLLMAVRRVRRSPVQVGMVWEQFAKVWKLLLAAILVGILTAIGFILLIIPGIYLLVSYQFVFILIADKNLGVWEALEASRKTVHQNWFKYFLWLVICGLVGAISAVLLLIPLIWTVPWILNTHGELYCNAFDRTAATGG